MSEFTNTMFESIKGALNQNTETKSNYKDILKYEAGKTYLVRLLPNVKAPQKTFFHYYMQGWQSFATGKYVSALSPATFNERDPISEIKYKLLKTGSEEEKKKAAALVRREQWLANVYVVSDPTTPDNNGKVKVLRFGKQLHKIITSAIEGEDAEEYGPKIFDLSKNGCNLKIVVENQGGFPTFVSSKFTSPKAIEGLDPKSIDNIYNSFIDLENMFPVRSYDQLKELLDEHFFCTTEVNDEPAAVQPTIKKSTENNTSKAAGSDDEEVKRLLDGLDDE